MNNTKTKHDNLLTILNRSNLDNALYYLHFIEGYKREMRLYAIWCAKQIQHLITDLHLIDALNVAERYANGQATDEEFAKTKRTAFFLKENETKKTVLESKIKRMIFFAVDMNEKYAARETSWMAATIAVDCDFNGIKPKSTEAEIKQDIARSIAFDKIRKTQTDKFKEMFKNAKLTTKKNDYQ